MTRGEIYRTAGPFIAENDAASLPPRKLAELNRALAVALDLD